MKIILSPSYFIKYTTSILCKFPNYNVLNKYMNINDNPVRSFKADKNFRVMVTFQVNYGVFRLLLD